MVRQPGLLLALALAAPVFLSPPQARSADRALPMRFTLHKPAATCVSQCQSWIAASGAITAETPRDFQSFAKGRELGGLTIALDSDGGSVLGAISLGREIRKLGLNTTVGRAVDGDDSETATSRASLSPRADCQSMCAFVLLAGVERSVPPQARVMVHQIWLGDRREDPTAANYSAEDLVLVQRDIGRLAQYTADMGASIDLLNLSLRIPPWEPMHMLTADEIKRMHVATDLKVAPAATVAVSTPIAAPITSALGSTGNAARPATISEQRWAVIERSGTLALARRNPLTIEGEDIGSFDLSVACSGPGSYDVTYAERRHAADQHPLPAALTAVTLAVGSHSTPLKIVSSQRDSQQPDELITFASATVPATLVAGFAAIGNHSIMVATRSALTTTGIRLGNTGAMQSLSRLAASCAKPLGERADLSVTKVGGLAAR